MPSVEEKGEKGGTPQWEKGVVTPQVNFPWKITFDMLYNNKFLLGVRSRALAIFSERTTI